MYFFADHIVEVVIQLHAMFAENVSRDEKPYIHVQNINLFNEKGVALREMSYDYIARESLSVVS